MPRDADSNKRIANMLYTLSRVDVWIGLHDQRKEGHFEWVDGTPLGTFTSWAPNQPDDNEGEDCATYWRSGGHPYRWNDAPCSRKLRFVCEFHLKSEDTGFSSIPKPGSTGRSGPEKGPTGPAGPVSAGPPGMTGQNVPKWIGCQPSKKALPCTSGPGTCYKAFIDRKEFNTAAETCCREGGTLAMPRDRISSRRIANMLTRYHTYEFWIGLHDQRKEGHFEWVDGTPLGAFQRWAPGQPDGDEGEDCATYWVYGAGGQCTNWNDAPCSRKLYFICDFHPKSEDTGFSSISKPGSTGRSGPEKGPTGPAGPVSAGPPGMTGQNVPKGIGCQPSKKALPCNSGSKTCYKAFKVRLDFNTAAERCCREGGTLAMPRGPKSNILVRVSLRATMFRNVDVWFGLHDQHKEGYFVWADGTPLGAFQRWAPNQPDDAKTGEDCVVYWGSGGQRTNWNDASCSGKLPFVCEFRRKSEDTVFSSIPKPGSTGRSGPEKGPMGPAGPVSVGPPGITGQNGPKGIGCQPSKKVPPCHVRENTCYKRYKDHEDFNTAAETCCREGGTLAMPRDADSNLRIGAMSRRFGNVKFWIGLHDQHKEGHFEWVDGTPLGTFQRWAPDQPDNYVTSDCAAGRRGRMYWFDAPCFLKLPFMCEFKPL
ncbi:C-type mannose receptor 2-like [Branchiostoma floridae x Branchiostoma belcheri]